MPVATYNRANEVKKLAEELIDKYHPHLVDAKDYIGYYYREGGQVSWGVKPTRNNPFVNKLTEGEMVTIFVVRGDWEGWSMERRLAEVDHALCHINRTSAGKIQGENGQPVDTWEDPEEPKNWSIRKHEVEDFACIVERHGLYYGSLEKFAEVAGNAPHQITIGDVEREAEQGDEE